ncbi:MAG: hypothetical protein WB630_10665 [Candidatus Acidiferrales bacterium]
MTRIYAWEAVYRKAIEETDPTKTLERVYAAEQVILERVKELASVATRHSINEIAWLQKAIERLEQIRLDDAPRSEPETPPLARAKGGGC